MIQINNGPFDVVYNVEARHDGKKYAGGVIYANSHEDALMIAKQLIYDIIEHKIEADKEENNDI